MRFTDDDIRADLERAIDAAGSLRRWAAHAGVSPAEVSQVRLGRKVGPRIAAALGYHRDDKIWVRDVRQKQPKR